MIEKVLVDKHGLKILEPLLQSRRISPVVRNDCAIAVGRLHVQKPRQIQQHSNARDNGQSPPPASRLYWLRIQSQHCPKQQTSCRNGQRQQAVVLCAHRSTGRNTARNRKHPGRPVTSNTSRSRRVVPPFFRSVISSTINSERLGNEPDRQYEPKCESGVSQCETTKCDMQSRKCG